MRFHTEAYTIAMLCLCVIAAALVPTIACGDEKESQWKPLFNGRDLTGWQVVGEPKDCWAVTDGLLHPTVKGGWLSTTDEFADFEIELDFILAPGSNSGLFLRAPHEGRTSRQGMEIQLIDESAEQYADLEDWQRTGALYHVQGPTVEAFTGPDQWQTLRVRVKGQSLTVWLNNTQTVQVDLNGYPNKNAEHPGLKQGSGFIGLQNYGGRDVQFNNIRIRELP